MAQDANIPWDDQTDQIITDIDDLYTSKGQVSLRELLLNPRKYIGKEGIDMQMQEMKKNVDSYFTTMLSGLADEQKSFDEQLAGTDLLYVKIDGVMATKASASRVPYISPSSLYMDTNRREEIVIEEYSDEIEAFIGKLVNASDYIANLSGTYKEHKLGSWIFSGVKTRVLSLRVPDSPILGIERSRDIISASLDAMIESAAPAKA